LAGGVPVFMPTTVESGYKITAEQLASAIGPKTKCLILNSPSNPTGMVYQRDELSALAKVLETASVFVISDEIYNELVYSGERPLSIAEFSQDLYEKTIVVNGVSKAYAMTGWRIGYAAGAVEVMSAVAKLQSHSTSNPTSISQYAALAALNGDQGVIGVMNAAFDRRRQLMVRLLNQIPGIQCVLPDGAFYAFPIVKDCYGKSSASGVIRNSVEFCDYLLSEKLVACVPGAGFGDDDCIRLSYATSDDLIEKGVARISEWVKSLG